MKNEIKDFLYKDAAIQESVVTMKYDGENLYVVRGFDYKEMQERLKKIWKENVWLVIDEQYDASLKMIDLERVFFLIVLKDKKRKLLHAFIR